MVVERSRRQPVRAAVPCTRRLCAVHFRNSFRASAVALAAPQRNWWCTQSGRAALAGSRGGRQRDDGGRAGSAAEYVCRSRAMPCRCPRRVAESDQRRFIERGSASLPREGVDLPNRGAAMRDPVAACLRALRVLLLLGVCAGLAACDEPLAA